MNILPWSEHANNLRAEENTNQVKTMLSVFLATHGYTLETFGDFIKKLDAKGTIIQIRMVNEGWEFSLLSLEDNLGELIRFNQDIYLQAKDLSTDSIMACVEEGFKTSEDRTGRFLFSKEAQVLYSFNRDDFAGDIMALKKFAKKDKQGGQFVQETYFKKTNNKTKRW